MASRRVRWEDAQEARGRPEVGVGRSSSAGKMASHVRRRSSGEELRSLRNTVGGRASITSRHFFESLPLAKEKEETMLKGSDKMVNSVTPMVGAWVLSKREPRQRGKPAHRRRQASQQQAEPVDPDVPDEIYKQTLRSLQWTLKVTKTKKRGGRARTSRCPRTTAGGSAHPGIMAVTTSLREILGDGARGGGGGERRVCYTQSASNASPLTLLQLPATEAEARWANDMNLPPTVAELQDAVNAVMATAPSDRALPVLQPLDREAQG